MGMNAVLTGTSERSRHFGIIIAGLGPRLEDVIMTRINSIAELRRTWNKLVGLLQKDLVGAGTLSADPVGTLAKYGYVLGPQARTALMAALP